MNLDERGQEILDLYPNDNLTLTQCRVAVFHCELAGWHWLGTSNGCIHLARETGLETSTQITIDTQGVVK